MSKASIHFNAVKSNSTAHNERKAELDYVYKDLSQDNESWKVSEIDARLEAIKHYCKETSGRKLQKNATPIREAVVNLKPEHTLEDLKALARDLEASKGIECFQIHIHRDEGKSRSELNYHAHMVFDWQDKVTGKMLGLKRADMSHIQDLVAQKLGMDRGEAKENSNRQRLEAVEYKRVEEEKRVKALELEVKSLEQKKNKLDRGDQQERAKAIKNLTENDIPTDRRTIREIREEDIVGAIEFIQSQIKRTESRGNEKESSLQDQRRQITAAEQHIERIKRQAYDLKATYRSYSRQVAKHDPKFEPIEGYFKK